MAVEGTGNGRKDPRPRSILSPAAQDPIGTRERERERGRGEVSATPATTRLPKPRSRLNFTNENVFVCYCSFHQFQT